MFYRVVSRFEQVNVKPLCGQLAEEVTTMTPTDVLQRIKDGHTESTALRSRPRMREVKLH